MCAQFNSEQVGHAVGRGCGCARAQRTSGEVVCRSVDGRLSGDPPPPGRELRRCCMNRHWPARCPPTGSSPADAIRRWSAEGGHPIQDLTAEDDLTPLPGWAPGAKPAQRPFSGLLYPAISVSLRATAPPDVGPTAWPTAREPAASVEPAPKSHAHCHGWRRWPASTPESADVVRGAPGVLVEPVACGVMAGPSARHRIRHGIRHTAARAGRPPRRCVANGRLRHMRIGVVRVTGVRGRASVG